MEGARTQQQLWGGRGAPLPSSERLTRLENPFHPSHQPSPPLGSHCQGCSPSCWWMSMVPPGRWMAELLFALSAPPRLLRAVLKKTK